MEGRDVLIGEMARLSRLETEVLGGEASEEAHRMSGAGAEATYKECLDYEGAHDLRETMEGWEKAQFASVISLAAAHHRAKGRLRV